MITSHIGGTYVTVGVVLAMVTGTTTVGFITIAVIIIKRRKNICIQRVSQLYQFNTTV